MRTLRTIVALAVAAPALGACWGDHGGYAPGYSPPASASSTSSSTTTEPARERSERAILRRDGSVVVVQRDRDGTRTYADSRGNYGVIPPSYSSSRRRR